MKGLIHMDFLFVNRILCISILYALYILYVAGMQNLLFKASMDVGAFTEGVALGCIVKFNFLSKVAACRHWFMLILRGTFAYLIFVASISSGASVKKITERNFFDN